MRSLQWSLVFPLLMPLALNACATTRITSELDPGVQAGSFSVVMVAAAIPNIHERQHLEQTLVESLVDRGYLAHGASALFFGGREYTEEMRAEQYRRYCIDAVLLVREAGSSITNAELPYVSTSVTAKGKSNRRIALSTSARVGNPPNSSVPSVDRRVRPTPHPEDGREASISLRVRDPRPMELVRQNDDSSGKPPMWCGNETPPPMPHSVMPLPHPPVNWDFESEVSVEPWVIHVGELFDIVTGDLVWYAEADSRSVISADWEDLAASSARMLAQQLDRDGLIAVKSARKGFRALNTMN